VQSEECTDLFYERRLHVDMSRYLLILLSCKISKDFCMSEIPEIYEPSTKCCQLPVLNGVDQVAYLHASTQRFCHSSLVPIHSQA